ncbi:hypothetical protein WISP_41173 [Willisornis vidua]|uniref:Uncharacterized protein n=1 Tax=Willisornis vidua TaxID=1566151 RepID=A0ABQ9DJR1_9PASS|nr:hypothetical protein WISP_41173 [Willisornis vidua]
MLLEEFVKNCRPQKGCIVEKFMKDFVLWKSPELKQEEECEEDEALETKCYEHTAGLVSHPSALLRGKEVEESEMKLKLGKMEGWKEVFKCANMIFLFGNGLEILVESSFA